MASRRGSISLYARADEGTPPGAGFSPFCYYDASANKLTHSALDPFGKIPEFKYCAVRVTAGGPTPVRVSYGGGQVLLRGQKGDRPWRVGIQHPRRPGVYFAYFSPGPGSVATSGDYEHAFLHEGVRYHHILDPATGYPSYASVAVTVFAPTALAADAIDTALFILGPDEGQRVARAEGVEALFIDPQMRIITTRGFRRELTLVAPLDAADAAPLPDGGPPARR